MRILHLATFLQGGAGRAIVDVAVAQRAAGHDVVVVTSALAPPGYGNYPGYLERLARSGIPLHQMDSMFERSYRANLRVVALLDRLYARGAEPQVVHAHAAIPSLAGLVFAGARRSAMAIVQTMHGWGIAKSAEQAATDVALMNLVDRVVVPSAHSSGLLSDLGVDAERLAIVPYGVSEANDQAGPLASRDRRLLEEMAAWQAQGHLVAACVGTIGPRKNQALVIDAMASGGCPLVRVVFVGDGEGPALQAAAEAAGIGARVRVHGFSPASRRIAAAADVLLLPSTSEGQPVSILEAFADGIPVLASDIPELVELVDDGRTGWHFQAGSAAALARELARFCSASVDQRRAVTSRAHAAFRERFTTERMVDGYERVYAGVFDRVTASGAAPHAA